MPPVTLNTVWMSVQRLPTEERMQLNKMLTDMTYETEDQRKVRTAKSIDQFFGGWSDDPRPIDEIKADVRNSRTTNSFFA